VTKTGPVVPRFSKGQRLQHLVLIASFSAMALTGLPQKYAATKIGAAAIAALGGIETVRMLHRVAAIVLMAATLYHLVDVAYRIFVRTRPLSMLPRLQDLGDALTTLRYNLGQAPARPRMGRYTFEEKLEYWALLWGNLVMIATGFVLWNPIATARLLPGQVIPASLVAHGSEAVLAVLSVIVWHGYGVHLRHFNRSMFTGTMTVEEMRAEHPLELDALEAGAGREEPAADLLRRRQRIFVPVAAVAALVVLAGLYRFVTFEETALPTVPRAATTPAAGNARP
jgi:cytochrome b subunit of formate dehydrogenase